MILVFKKGQKPWIMGKHHSEKTRRKIGITQKGKILSEEHKKKISIKNKGRIVSEETKRKYRITMQKRYPDGIKRTEEQKKKMRGFKHSEETKRKLSESHKGKGLGKDNPMFGKKHTLETRKIIRKKRWDQVVPTKDTKFELSIQSLLREKGIEFEKHKSILGQPDIFIKPNLCIFLDGDFHHANPSKYSDDAIIWNERISKTSGRRMPAKTAKMIQEKDKRIRDELRVEGKKIITGWYSDWRKDKEKFFQKILKAIKESRR